jgi:hypothetical protein
MWENITSQPKSIQSIKVTHKVKLLIYVKILSQLLRSYSTKYKYEHKCRIGKMGKVTVMAYIRYYPSSTSSEIKGNKHLR